MIPRRLRPAREPEGRYGRIDVVRLMLPGVSDGHIYRLANLDYWRRKRHGRIALYNLDDVQTTRDTRHLGNNRESE